MCARACTITQSRRNFSCTFVLSPMWNGVKQCLVCSRCSNICWWIGWIYEYIHQHTQTGRHTSTQSPQSSVCLLYLCIIVSPFCRPIKFTSHSFYSSEITAVLCVPHFYSLYELAGAAVAKSHSEQLNQRKMFTSSFHRPEVQDQGVGRATSPLQVQGRGLSKLLGVGSSAGTSITAVFTQQCIGVQIPFHENTSHWISSAGIFERRHIWMNFFSSCLRSLVCFFLSFTGLKTIHFKWWQNAWGLNCVTGHFWAKRINIAASLCALRHW